MILMAKRPPNFIKSDSVEDFPVWCKRLSDCVLYLVVFKPSCLTTASEYQKTIGETLAEAVDLFIRGNKTLIDQKKACEEIWPSQEQ